ncbi:enoyl-CoA hydratase family protein [Prauserella cavernicola]|uniref:Enoyl-CoA hydratase family protein n=1 Tax=Prauserella cavernicola TaxID=2800127 RepID=A0A934QTZ7_9PSEU|nr:enoyl-CoA hydratase family protein [Prauserella cavernicola]MBK1786470.1 enoyl-CoA hydratase family protein [Prauserella cavernicola]
MADELVHYDVTGGVATITLDSPHNRNALSAQLRRELSDGLERAIADDAVRVVVLTHTGSVFCAGMDLKEARGAGSSDQGVNEFPAILERIWTSPKPVVARLAGPARAGGVGIVAAADIAVASDNATFAFSEVRLGLIPAIISVTVLPRLTPRAAHELFLTGDVFDAERAAVIGLINAAVPAEELDATVERYVRSLAHGGPVALASTKELLQGESGREMPKAFAEMLATSSRFFASEEGQEGITAFGEKRKPSWVPEA